ncbi:protein phosphatase 1 regulatory subunit 1C isoform X4 [Gadus chalcogrammus]|uniref:protein phosphatase 1 regulatory subunit 1C isoform X4 n=1 Tax=Gadus chalcogrammus TaxID=1042646 RepID=UPI0024C4C13D|nr:protein phosphatase 1 regulatory subunit 1C isoform X4 [Gadus chalcogrammus]
MEPSSPKKLQFDVPPLQGQLDPQAAEHIRRRRPTPATLQIYRLPIGTDAGGQNTASGETQDPEAAQRKQGTYAAPTMKGKHSQPDPSLPEEDEDTAPPQD